MNRLERLVLDLKSEGALARDFLAIIPEDKYDWQPHPKSMSVRQLASHIAELPEWVTMTIHTKELDFATTPYTPAIMSSNTQLIDKIDAALEGGIQALITVDDAALDEQWTLRNGDNIFSTGTKEDFIHMSLNQIVHHRAQLGVFLRLLDVPVPATYGPSADAH